MKVNQYFLLFVVFLLGILFSHVIGGDLIEGKNKLNSTQQCNGGATYDKDTGECACPNGKIYDKNDKECECPGSSYTLNDGSCTCPGGASYDKNTGDCLCPDGTIYHHNQYYKHCPCPSGKTYNNIKSKCE